MSHHDEHLDAIAIIGLAGRLPGAPDLDQLWRNLRSGTESITRFSSLENAAEPRAVAARGVLADVELFDPAFFGLTRKESELLDPQHRMFLECAWRALADAGYDAETYPGAIGVFGGCGINDYLPSCLAANPEAVGPVGRFQLLLTNGADFLTTRVSYKLGLRGPSVTVQTACSTSLVAVHLAARSLLDGECDMALAGGARIALPQEAPSGYQEGGVLSPDGHCRAFDAAAQGTVPGNGVGVVLLKRFEDARADGDPIRAILRGSAANNDGALKVSFTAPGPEGQANVIREALGLAGVDPATVSYVETHGTGTALGDPIEVAALTDAFGDVAGRRGYCALGSLKTNVGHLDAAAGVASLIKAVLALEHRELPPSLHFERPNPKIDFAASPFFVNDRLRPWPRGGTPRRAGVSSFGIGGTNVHVVLEEAPPPPAPAPGRPCQLFVLSAGSAADLETAAAELAGRLEARPELSPDDVAFTLQVGRRARPHRLALVAEGSADAAAALRGADPRRLLRALERRRKRPIAFLLPGQGAQRAGMARGLYRCEPSFRADVDRCSELLAPRLGFRLAELLDPPGAQPGAAEDLAGRLAQTAVTQPLLFVLEIALARLWQRWLGPPWALVGHSLGEIVAACLAGVLALEDALELVAARGRLMQELPGGAMLAVALGAVEAEALAGPRLALAAVNGEQRAVLSGPTEAVDELAAELSARGVKHRRLETSHAFHSSMVEPVLAPFRALVARLPLQAPEIPWVSTATGRWIEPAQATDPDYWAHQLRATVRFHDALGELLRESELVLLEVGPGRELAAHAARHPAAGAGHTVLTSLSAPGVETDDRAFFTNLGRSWLAGAKVDWEGGARGEGRRRLSLPVAPLERERCWIDPKPIDLQPAAAAAPALQTPPASAERPAAVGQGDLLGRVAKVFGDLLGMDPATIDPDLSFLELGADSLLLVQANDTLRQLFGVEVTFAQLMDELSSVRALTAFLAEHLPAAALASAPAPAPASATPPVPVSTAAPASAAVVGAPASLSPSAVPLAIDPVRSLDVGSFARLRPEQERYLRAFSERYVAKTARSKAHTQRHRGRLADNRVTLGFRRPIKELVYPIVAVRSAGVSLWDVDDNEYVDFTLGFGVHMLGHQPPYVAAAVREQLERGFQLGPQSELAGEVAELFAQLTGHERVAFTNTGTEAVMTALRLVRTRTRRPKVALFSGSYHGGSDGVLVRSGPAGAVPSAAGIPPSLAHDLLVLDYPSQSALDAITRHAGELAAVLVEPVQNSRPDLQPREFLHQLRELTARLGIALIFDEMVTGFRIHQRGAQGFFGIHADLATYGKVVGSGLPIGVIAGSADYLDAIDGGRWQYGDDSFPAVAQTFYAGTFNKHPLSMAAARAVLRHLIAEGPELQERLNRRADALVARSCAALIAARLPMTVLHCGSMFRFAYPPTQDAQSLLFYHLVERGLYLWESRSGFLSTEHTDEHLDRFVATLEEGIEQMRAGGYLPVPAESAAVAPVADTEQRAPLTEIQRQLWTHTQLGEAAARAYNEHLALRLRGPLDEELLRRALQEVVDNHEALRARFDREGREQRFAARLAVALERIALPEPTRAELRARIEQEVRRSFDLETGPVGRFCLFALGRGDHLLLLVFHHLAVDARSAGIVLEETAHRYSAYRRGEPVRLPPPMQLGDYARAEQARREQTGVDAAEAFWLEHLQGRPERLELPLDRPRPPRQTFAAASLSLGLDSARLEALRSLGARARGTLFMTLLAAFQLALARLSGQDDVIVGIASSVRTRVEEGYLIGHFINLLPVRARLETTASFASHLGQTRRTLLEAYRHQGFPFGKLIQQLGVRFDPSRSPLFGVTFNLERLGEEGGLVLEGLVVEPFAELSPAVKLDWSIDVEERPDGARLHAHYNVDLYDATTVRRWLELYRRLLAELPAAADRPLSLLAGPGPAERHQLLVERNDTRGEIPETTLHARVAEIARRAGDVIALAWDDGQMSYGELTARAAGLAERLRALGAANEVPVAVLLERGPELILALLAILEAGGPYLPLDPHHPAERLGFQLADAGARLVVSSRSLAERLPQGATVVLVETAPRAARAETGTGSADGLAYLLYTSGSTGRPKAVATPHRAVMRLVHGGGFARLAGETFLQLAPVAFDASTLEIWGPLTSGGRLALPVPGLLAGAQLEAVLRRFRVTTLWLTAGLFHQLAEERSGALGGLRQLLAGGDVLLPGRVAALARAFPALTLINGYGPTENTTFTCCHPLRASLDAQRSVPIGRPIGNTRVYVTDARLHLAPQGSVGELVTGGAGLARGYHRRPALTAERFVPDPFGVPGERLYRTGDRVRWLAEGTLEFHGRGDHQVKVRGFRVELGEVEAALARHPQVSQAVVLASEEAGSERRLIAGCAVGEGALGNEGAPSAAQLREFLLERLPEPMVPSRFVILPALPLTPNGKVGRAALLELAAAEPGAPTLAPRGEVEQLVAELWGELLGIEQIGAEDDFFALGGNSLVAIRTVARLRATLGCELGVGDLLDAPSVAGFARKIVAALATDAERLEPPPVQAVLRHGPAPLSFAPLSFAQRRLWFLDQLAEAGALYNVPAVLPLPAALDVAALAGALAEIVRRHEVLRTRFEQVDGEPRQVIGEQLPSLAHVDLGALRPGEGRRVADRLAHAEARRPFDLARGPLLRTTLVRLDAGERLLLFTVHHAVFDGWSMEVLLRELRLLYRALHRGEPSALAPLPVQYADFAAWQRGWLVGEARERLIAWWRRQLDGVPALSLPADRPRPRRPSWRGAVVPFVLETELTRDLRRLARTSGATLFMTLLALFQLLLRRWCGQDDVAVGTVVAGRDRPELEGLIGFFVNTLVLRTRFTGDPETRELVAQTRRMTLEALAHQQLPFEMLVEQLQPERASVQTPLFQVMFLLQSSSGIALEPAVPLAAPALEPHTGTAKFDLTLALREEGEGLAGRLEYSTDRFDATTLRRLADRLRQLLAAAVGAPETPVSRVSRLGALPPAERHQLLAEWNDTTAALPEPATLHGLVAEQAGRRPHATALIWDDGRMSYGELDRRANQLAHHLRATGVRPDDPVGICLERGAATLVALLGVLKAGGAYLPLDPSHPTERLGFLIEDAGCRVVVSESQLARRLPGTSERRVLLDLEAEPIALRPDRAPGTESGPDHLAYVLYTSGSTGKPKGVATPHRAVVRLVRGGGFAALAGEVFLQFAPLAFDASTLEIWGPLANGGRLAIMPPGPAAPAELAAALERHAVTSLWLTAGLFHQMVEHAPAALGQLGQLLAGGDTLSAPHVETLLERSPGLTLINGYGPTEGTTFTCCHPLRGILRLPGGVPIGRPIGNTRIYVVDGALEAVPMGSAGELAIAGAGLARGYHRRPALTAERFVPDPFGGAGSRLYRSGDEVRLRADGTVEFRGRRDGQVKLRGFRIELGEVEAALASHPQIAAAAAQVVGSGSEDRRLLAYVVIAAGAQPPAVEALRVFLAERLPEPMLPARVIPLDALPLTANGKVDRRALPLPTGERPALGVGFTPPRTVTEEVLVGLWQETLGVEPVGIFDDFFALGGHSLLATGLMTRVRESFQTDVPLSALFEQPTVAGLAAHVERLALAEIERLSEEEAASLLGGGA